MAARLSAYVRSPGFGLLEVWSGFSTPCPGLAFRNIGQTPCRFAGVRNTSDCGHPRQATSPRRFSTHRRRLLGCGVVRAVNSQIVGDLGRSPGGEHSALGNFGCRWSSRRCLVARQCYCLPRCCPEFCRHCPPSWLGNGLDVPGTNRHKATSGRSRDALWHAPE